MIRPHIPTSLRHVVTARAKHQCEYCLVHEDDRPESHQIDHVIALKHGGQTTEENLALACALCNNQKGSDLATIDLETEKIVPLFNPRKDTWTDHFQLSEAEIVGISTVGQATVRLLRLNEPDRVLFRRLLIEINRYPMAEVAD